MQISPREPISVLPSQPEHVDTPRTPPDLATESFDPESFQSSDAELVVAPDSPLASGTGELLGRLGPDDADALLLALADYLRTLGLVREAHQRGAIQLPAGLAERVVSATRELPTFLAPPPQLGDQ